MTPELRVATLERQNTELVAELAASNAVAKALVAGEIDAVVSSEGSTPILLRAAQERLREQQLMLRAIFDGALDAMFLVDDQGRYVDANPAACELFGLAKDALMGRTILEFVDPATAPMSVWSTFFAKGRLQGEFPLLRPDGVRRTLEFSATANVIPGLHLSSLRDVTARKQQEAALLETQRFLEEAQAVAEVGGWVARMDFDAPLYWSKESYRIAGLPDRTPLTLRTLFERVVHADDAATVQAELQTALGKRTVFQSDHRLTRPDGEVRWVHARGIVERDPAGEPQRVTGTIQDITDRRRSTALLRESEERYRRIVETTSQGVWLSDEGYRTTFVNQPMAEMLGYTRDEMVGQTVFAFLTEQGRAIAEVMFKRRAKGQPESYENSYCRKDGSTLWALAKTNAIFDGSGSFSGTVGLLTDMTVQHKLEEQRSRLAVIVESSHDAIFSSSLDGTIASWNRAAAQLFGHAGEDIVDRSSSLIVPSAREAEHGDILRRVGLGEHIELDTFRQRANGSLVEVTLLVSPLREGSGRVVGASTIAHDITLRRQHEAALQRSTEQLRQGQKMEAIGTLAGGVAHDFNNLLSVILSYTAMLVADLKPNDPMRTDLEEIHTAGLRAADLTRQLLAFSRQQVLQPAVLDLMDIVEGLRKMLGRLLGENIVLSLIGPTDLGKVYADAGQIEQVLMNLVVNARDAMPKGGSLTVELTNILVDAEYAAQHRGIAPGGYVTVTVTDTGTGMDAATQEKIFDPFFTTKEEGKGTGLGLATVHGIVQQSGGHISVYSEIGVGTMFKLLLPRTDRQLESRRPPAVTASSSFRGTETILLVEDEDQVRAVARSILSKQGYNVLEAQNGGEAYLISEQFPGAIHLLLTDIVMPRMSGREVAERLVRVRRDMKVLFVSGYTKDTSVHHGVLDASVSFLSKPLTPEALARKVREVLDADERASRPELPTGEVVPNG